MNTIYIINVSEDTETGFFTYTFANYFDDISTVLSTITAMAEFYAQNTEGATYVGHVEEENAYCVRKGESFIKTYSVQTLTSFESENVIERIC